MRSGDFRGGINNRVDEKCWIVWLIEVLYAVLFLQKNFWHSWNFWRGCSAYDINSWPCSRALWDSCEIHHAHDLETLISELVLKRTFGKCILLTPLLPSLLWFWTYYLLTGCKGRTRKYKSKVFHTARACEGCLENQGLVFPRTARAPS